VRAFSIHAGPSVVGEGDRKQNWEFYRHLWLALLMAPDSQSDHMDIGETHGRTGRTTLAAFARL